MNETSNDGRIVVAVALFAIGLVAVAVAATGSVAAVEDHCEDVDEPAVVGVVADETYKPDENLELHVNSTVEVVFCDADDEPEDEWLNESELEGLEVTERPTESDEHYEFVVVGITDEIVFEDAVTVPEYEETPEAITVTVATSEYATDEAFAGVDWIAGTGSEYELHEENYLGASEDLTASIEELNETTASDDGLDLEAGAKTLEKLEDRHEAMTTNETKIVDYLNAEAAAGNTTGTFSAIDVIETEQADRTAALEDATSEYRDAVANERTEPQSTVQFSLFGSLIGGLLVGAVAGAAIPLVAARRVEEKMKLSRNVNYDRKTALLPMLVGTALVIAGLVVLTVLLGDGLDLFRVIR
ncbi:hypothetical protein G6M89_08070 [Natronolimnobius sp. AArcel1]|uniref:hypothetical protein n=1 Tax=Natronolimnobius sp. AArcel1 TaxID=1679093 RepID=UPI0013ED5ED1|nr:hypothetical protein [Natronolimnobius sp. AArcel1]NGM68968.1 hypothetical protein [Natronolimnobius sp. AArcel1]